MLALKPLLALGVRNHLDIESREALVFALADYSGAVMLVSHDPHLVSAIADRLWLVKDGAVSIYDGDIEAYRAQILGEQTKLRRPKVHKAPKPSKAEVRAALAPFKAEVSNCEQRLVKLGEMQTKMLSELGDKALYTGENADRYEFLTKKYDELKIALKKAELLWIKAVEDLETKETEYAQK